MKKIILSAFILLAFLPLVHATKHVVTVANTQFTPAVIPNVFVGDTIRWVWVSGGHTTTSTSVPSGASPWDSPIDGGSTSFEYKVEVPGSYQYVCLFHGSMTASFTASIVTPVKLATFAVEGTKERVSLSWKTENEQNVDHYSVRRSTDGSNFKEVAQIPAKGNNSSTESYSYSDIKISSSQRYYYYSLAVVDRDGRRTYSQTKMFKNVEGNTKIVLTLSPNPISSPGHLNMTFNAETEGKMQVKVINSEGKVIISSLMQAYPGVNNGHVHLGELPSGAYSLVCTMNGVKETHKILYK